jgi:GT2 family glycosyltransferase
MREQRLAVVLLNWKQAALTVSAAVSIMETAYEGILQLVVVDNGSEDGSIEYFRNHLPNAHLIASKQNRGFAGGVNLALTWCLEKQFEAVCLINNDAVPEPGALNLLADQLFVHPSIAAVGAVVLDATTLALQAWGGGTLNIWSGRERARAGPGRLDYITGTCMLLRCSALTDVGLFDEQFFMYWEDADLCRRFRNAGWTIGVASGAIVRHVGQTSVGRNSPAARQYYLVSLVLFFQKHNRFWQLPVVARLGRAFCARVATRDLIGAGDVMRIARRTVRGTV